MDQQILNLKSPATARVSVTSNAPVYKATGISQELDALIPPIPPHEVSVYYHDGITEIEWDGTGSDIITHYVIYRRAIKTEEWIFIGRVDATEINRGTYVYHDSTTGTGVGFEYAVAAVDLYGNESGLTVNDPSLSEKDI